MDDRFERLNGVFRRVFDDDSIRIGRETTADDIEDWDSITHMNLIMAVELEFGVKFSARQMMTFKNVGDLFDAVAAQAAGKA